MCDFKKQIQSAKEEIARWTPEKKSYVQLEGTDRYTQQRNTQNSHLQTTQEKKDIAK